MTLRDLIVSIDFDDIDINRLLRVDTAMDQIEDGLMAMGRDVKDAGREFKTLERHGGSAMDEIRSETKQAETAIDALGDEGKRAMDQIEDGADDARKKTQQFNKEVDRSGGSMNSLMGTAKKVAGVLATVFAIDKAKDLGLSMIENAAAAQATNSQFEQVYKGMEGTATDALNAIGDQTNILPTRLKGSFISMAAFAKTSGADTAQALKISERATLAAADGAAFMDKSIEDVTESMKSFLKGNFENDAALGISATEFTRNSAATELFGKKFKDLSEIQKQETLLKMVEDGNKLSGALGQAAREGDGFENILGNMKQRWEDLKATLGGKLLDPAIDAMKAITKYMGTIDTDKIAALFEKGVDGAGKFFEVGMAVKDTIMALYNDTGDVSDIWQKMGLSKENADLIAELGEILKTGLGLGLDIATDAFDLFIAGLTWAKDNMGLITALGYGVAGSLVAFQVATQGALLIGTLTKAMALFKVGQYGAMAAQLGLNTAMLASPLTWIVVGIGAVIAIGVLLYRNWDTVSEKAGKLWDKTKEVFGGMYDWGVSKIQPVADFFSNLGAKFGDFKDKITSFKLPDWVNSIGGKIGGAVKWLAGGKPAVDGSHATGLNRVPFDGYTAELHKDEAVLTARQADALRASGVLSGNSQKPNVDTQSQNISSGSGRVAGGGGTFAPQVHIQIDGTGLNEEQVGQKVKEKVDEALEAFFRKMNLKQA